MLPWDSRVLILSQGPHEVGTTAFWFAAVTGLSPQALLGHGCSWALADAFSQSGQETLGPLTPLPREELGNLHEQ